MLSSSAVSPTQATLSEVAPRFRTATLRVVLLAGGFLAALGAFALGNPADLQAGDPELGRLLRAMALIKGTLVAGALSVLWWRFRWPVGIGLGAGYLVGAWLITGATIMIWQLTAIAAAAVAFHLGEITLLVLAWHDHRQGPPASPRATAA